MQSQSNSFSRDDGFQAWPPKRSPTLSVCLEEAGPGIFWRCHKEHWLASLNRATEGDLREQSV